TPRRAPPSSLFSFTAPPPARIYPLSLHDALPISRRSRHRSAGPATAAGSPPTGRGSCACTPRGESICASCCAAAAARADRFPARSEEHTSELQSRSDLVCRLLLEKKKKNIQHYTT